VIKSDLAQQVRQVIYFSPVGLFALTESGQCCTRHNGPEWSTRSRNRTKFTLVVSSCIVCKGPLESPALVENHATNVENPQCCIFPMNLSLSRQGGVNHKQQTLPCVIYADLLPNNNKVICFNCRGWVWEIQRVGNINGMRRRRSCQRGRGGDG